MKRPSVLSIRKASSTISPTGITVFNTSLPCRLFFGRLNADDYEDEVAADPRIDKLRNKMMCIEDPKFTRDYYDPEKRSIANGITMEFNDGSRLDEVVVEYPVGHRSRRGEAISLLEDKFRVNLARRFSKERQQEIIDLCLDEQKLASTPVDEFVGMFVV